MRTVFSLLFAVALACAGSAQAATKTSDALYAKAVREGTVAVGVICKHPEDFREIFKSPTWMNPKPDPERALEAVRKAKHDPKVCASGMMLYTGTPERVDRIVRKPSEVYFVIRFTPLDIDGVELDPAKPEYRYLLVPGK